MMKVISMVIGNLELPVYYEKKDIDSSEAKAHMLTLIRAWVIQRSRLVLMKT
jgi:hypothetical protein